MSYAKNWCFTLFGEAVQFIWNDPARMVVWQQEQCPETGRLHYQGCIAFNKRMRAPGVKAVIGHEAAHIEICKGSLGTNLKYCTKEESRINGPWYWPSIEVWNDIKGQGKRTDLDELKESLDNGATMKEISQDHFAAFLKYSNGIRNYISLQSNPRVNTEMIVKFWYGKTGTGKTRAVFKEFDHSEVYVVMRPTNGSLYYDGYIGQKCILFDDFYGWAPISHMLNIMDRYPMMLKVHGGMVPLLESTTTIIITSNNNLEALYENVSNEEVMRAFRRRITECKQFISLQ